jgi:hypothetical protein
LGQKLEDERKGKQIWYIGEMFYKIWKMGDELPLMNHSFCGIQSNKAKFEKIICLSLTTPDDIVGAKILMLLCYCNGDIHVHV